LAPSAVIFGCEGPRLTAWERDFFAEADPLGFILFQRNCEDPAQLAALTAALRDSVGREDAPVLIDQEGGRVQRLKPPQWRAAPPAARFGALAKSDPEAAVEATRLNARLLAEDLRPLGIDVDCLPLLDLPAGGAHDVIGDRAYSSDPELVATLGRASSEGLLAGGVLPVVKHIPGHGRCAVDSHAELPRVDADISSLEATDFYPFRALNDLPLAMTAHAIYSAIDPHRPATTSSKVIEEVVRGLIGFKGLLMSDDISMKALSGDIAWRSAEALAAGCDLVLHCNGERGEMTAVASATSSMPETACAGFRAARAALPSEIEPVDRHRLEQRLSDLLAGV
jgi:beta-N-acetylhexosaminidase